VAVAADDDGVVPRDAESRRIGDPLPHVDVGAAGRRVARGMIVHLHGARYRIDSSICFILVTFRHAVSWTVDPDHARSLKQGPLCL
jgi:hypothetical protein